MKRDTDRLRTVVQVIARVRRRLENQQREQLYADDRDELDLTAFRLSVIGEETNKLSVELKHRHPEIPWAAIYQLRNVFAHGYDQIDPARIWVAVGDKLLTLATVCEAELDRGD